LNRVHRSMVIRSIRSHKLYPSPVTLLLRYQFSSKKYANMYVARAELAVPVYSCLPVPLGYDPSMKSICFCFCFPFFFPPGAGAAATATSSLSLPPATSSCAARSGAQADVVGGALPRICWSWPVRAETIGRALGAAEPGNVGNAESVSAGAGGGGAGGGRPP